MKARPNILVVLSDDHGQWASNCYGTKGIRSPHIDLLATSGVRMANAFTPTPVCSPARASFFTGRMPSQHGVHDYLYERIPEIGDKAWMEKEQTLYQLLQDAGYRIGHFGKWHCGQSHIPQPGTDVWFSLPGRQGGHCESYTYCDQGKQIEVPGFKSRIITDRALNFIRGASPNQPWMAFVGLIATHRPHQNHPERLVAGYRDVANRDLGTHAPPPDAYIRVPEAEAGELQAQYYAAVSEIDEQLGRLLDTLNERDQLDNTVVVYTSDHGLHAGQNGYWEKGNGTRPLNFYERSIRIPMLVRAPRHNCPGTVCESLVDLCDLFHTLLDFAGAPLSEPQLRAGRHAGKSFLPLLKERNLDWREAQFGEYGPVRMVRTNTHKLIRRHGRDSDQLFDLRIDPEERTNLLCENGLDAIVADLDARLARFFERHHEPGHDGLNLLERHVTFNADQEAWRPEFSLPASP